jgi:glycosyltransferase involved in cell wall biosynthesis
MTCSSSAAYAEQSVDLRPSRLPHLAAALQAARTAPDCFTGTVMIATSRCNTVTSVARSPDAKGANLRICHLAKFYPPAPGGIESHVRTLAQAQAGLGAAVRVLCVNHLDGRGQDVTWQRLVRTRTVEEWDGAVRVTRLGKWGNIARLDLCPGLFGVLRRLRGEVDVLHLHAPNPTMTLALATLRLERGLVVTHHSDVIRQRVLGRLFRPVERLVYDRAERILCTSPRYAEGSPLLAGYNGKVGVLTFGIDLRPYREPSASARAHAARLRAQHGEPLWLSVGRLVYYKGLHNAVRALVAVTGRLLVIGEGPARGELKRLAAALGIADRIIWRGHVSEDELIGAYYAATALWFPSNARSEGFGLVQVEAMASGCPVINTAIPASGVAWVSRHEETGLTVLPDDPGALAAAARRLVTEPGLRQRLAQGACARAAVEFDDRLMGQRSLEAYSTLLAVSA